LFYYILKEADRRGKHRKLGPVGSLLVGSTVFAALQADKFSFLNATPAGRDWTPTLGRNGRFRMTDILRIAGVLDPNGA
jgi:hypothetical protein